MKLVAGFSSRLRVPQGFVFSGIAAGLKRSGALDLGLVEAPGGAAAGAVFTRNLVVAAPLVVGRRHLESTSGRVRAVVVNSGNANCATGSAGERASERVCRLVAATLGVPAAQIFPASTGVIGVPLPVGRISAALPELLRSRRGSLAALRRFARAIMTTDTRPKVAGIEFRCQGGTARLLGVAKGAGMIHPHLAPLCSASSEGHATMLVYLFTDLAAALAQLQRLLGAACARTFNRISVDGDTSTNDTVLLLANGASGHRVRGPADGGRLAAALEAVCGSLARQIVGDGEGARHLVELEVEGARNEADAERMARAIANSPLVKTAWAGADPNWGRILAAIGASGVRVDPRRIDIFFGRMPVCRRGAAWPFSERAAHAYLSRREVRIRVRLGQGRARTRFWTCDLTADYAHINADYRT